MEQNRDDAGCVDVMAMLDVLTLDALVYSCVLCFVMWFTLPPR